jgi:DNA-binding response OmpR family regulator
MRVLVVDPRASSRCAIAYQVVHHGFDVATAADIGYALRLAEIARPALVLVHHELPGALALVLALGRVPGHAIPAMIVRSDEVDEVLEASDAVVVAAAP